MKQGNKMGVLASLIKSFGYEGVDHLLGSRVLNVPRKGRQKNRRPKLDKGRMYKSATSGFPRSSKPCGSVPAPTIDQVRQLEQAYMLKLDVHHGIIYFKEDQTVFSKDEAAKRRGNTYKDMFAQIA